MTDIFVDSDILLDLLLKREPFFLPPATILSLAEQKKLNIYTSPVIITNIYYIIAKLMNKQTALKSIRNILKLVNVAAVDEKVILLALESNFKDFEDSVQYYTAKNSSIQFLLTRNKGDYPVE
ncbi:PIN domain-containing protein, partial [candidate division KSB1 bacterium]|nr:PIN domain-containing protein [candidate division KSB1 bacterium]